MTRRVAAILALACAALAVSDAAHGARDPARRWFTLETERFTVSSYDGGEALAREVAAYCEEAFDLINPLLGWTPRERIHVVVADEIDAANGFAIVLPFNTFTIWAHPPPAESDLGDYANWLKLLVFHEYTHIAHIDNATGVPALVNLLFGRSFKPNQALPRWVTEGIAVWVESTLTGGGRVGASRMEMYMRTAALAGRLPTLGDLTGYPLEHPRGTSWYLYGGYLFTHIAREAGPESVKAFATAYGRRLIPFSLNQVARETTGKGLDVWYEEVLDAARARARAVDVGVRAAGLTEGAPFTRGGEHKASPRFSPDGARLAWVDGDGHRPGHIVSGSVDALFAACPAGAELDAAAARACPAPAPTVDLVRCEGGCGDLAFTRDGGRVVFGTARHHRVVNYYGLLGVIPAAEGVSRRAVRELPATLRAQQPAVDPDGRRVWYVTSDWGRTRLEAVELATGDVVARIEPPTPSARLDHPAPHPDGERLFVSMHAEGNRDLYQIDLASGRFTRLTADAALELDPSVTADGRWLVYSADLDGVYDVYARELATGQTRRLTRVRTGAFDPVVSPDGRTLVYAGWTADGFELYRLPFAPHQAPVVAPVVEAGVGADSACAGCEAVAPRASRPAEPPRPAPAVRLSYQALPTMLPRSWVPTWVTDSTGLSRLGLSLGGTDLAGLWTALVGFEWDLAREDFSAVASATLRLGYPDVGLTVGRYSWDRTEFVGDRFGDYEEEVVFGTVNVFLPLPSVFTGLSVGMGYTVDLTRALAREGLEPTPDQRTAFVPREGLSTALNLFWTFSDIQAFSFSVSPQLGGSLSMNLRIRDPAIGSTRSTTTLTWVGRAYLPMPLDDHVLSIRLEGGVSGGDTGTRAQFALGGVPAQDLLSDLINQTSAGAVWLRGFPAGALQGTSYHLLTTEYRLPLWRPRRGLDSLPLFFGDVTAAVFVDAAAVGDARDDRGAFDQIAVGLGAELRFTADLFYGLDLAFRLGYARGLGEYGADQVYFLMAPAP